MYICHRILNFIKTMDSDGYPPSSILTKFIRV